MAYRTGKSLDYDPFEDVGDYHSGDPLDYDPFEDEEEKKKKGIFARAKEFFTPKEVPPAEIETEQRRQEAIEAQEPVKPATPLTEDLRAEREGVAPEREPLGIPGPGEASEFMAAPGQLGEPILKEELAERPITPFEQAYQKEMAELEGRPADELEQQLAADKAAEETGEAPAGPTVDPETGRPLIADTEPWRWSDAKKDVRAWTKERKEREKRHQKTLNEAKKRILEKDPNFQFPEGKGPWIEDPRELHELRAGYADDTDSNAERDLTGEAGGSFANQFGSRMGPGGYTGFKEYQKGLYTTNYYLWLQADTKQKKGLDSVVDQIAKKAHPDNVQKQEAYKVRFQQEASDLWGTGHLVDDLIFSEAEKHGAMLRERPNDIVTWSNPPENMEELRKKTIERNLNVQKDIEQFYKDNPDYKLPDDWKELDQEEREVKYPGIFWGETISTNIVNSFLSIGTYMGVQTATKSPGLATLMAGAVLFPQFVKEIDAELTELERREGIKVPDEVKSDLTLIGAIPSAFIEGLGERLGFGPALLKHFGKNVGKKAMKRELIRLFVQKAMSKKGAQLAKKGVWAVARPTLWTAKQSGAGYVEEGGQKMVSNAAAQFVGSERSLFEGVHEQGRIGAVMEPVLGGPAASTQYGYGVVAERRAKKKVEAAGKEARDQIDRLLKDYDGQTAEDILLDEDLAPEAAAERVPAEEIPPTAPREFVGAEGIEAEEVAAEFTAEELEAAAAEAPEVAPAVEVPAEPVTALVPEKAPPAKAPPKAPEGIIRVAQVEAEREAPTRIAPSKRKTFQALADEMGEKSGAKIRFDNVIYQNEKPVGLQMTVTSGAAKGATFTLSGRAHKTKAEAQRFVDTVIKGYAQALEAKKKGEPFKEIAGIIKKAQKPEALKKEYNDLVASLSPEQKKSVLDLIKDKDMALKEKLGLMRADLAAFEMKKAAPPAPPKKVEVVPEKPPAAPPPVKKLGPRWKAAPAAKAGEPSFILDTGAGLVEHKLPEGTLIELVSPEGASLGMFKDRPSAATAAEDMFEEPTAAAPPAKPAAPPPPAPALPKGAAATQRIVREFAKNQAAVKGVMPALRKMAGLKAWDKMSAEEQLAEARAQVERDVANIPADMERLGINTIAEYATDRALDPLDPLNEFYAELLRRQGYEVEAGKTVKPPAELEAAPPEMPAVPEEKPDLKGGPRVAPQRATTPEPTSPPEATLPAKPWEEFVKPGGVEESYVKIALGVLDPRSYETIDKARQWIVDKRDEANAYTKELEEKGVTENPVLKYDHFKRKAAYMDDLLDKLRPIAEKFYPKPISKKAETRIITPQNAEGHRAHYTVVEAGTLFPSHNPETFQPYGDYPEGIQERAYHSDTAEQAKVITNANKLDPRILLSDDPTPTSGPPIVDQSDFVISGNSRTMSIQLAFKDPKKAARYKNQLIAAASKFGLAPKDIKPMKQPVLIRRIRIESEYVMRALAREFNETMTQGMGQAAETASMGKAIKPATMEKIGIRLTDREISLRELLGKKDGLEILGWLIDDGAISATQKNVYLNEKGDLLNKRGKEVIELAIFGNIVDDLDLINSAQKSHLNKIEKSLAELAKVKARGGKWDITSDLKEGLRLATAAQAQDLSVRDLLAQQPLFEAKPEYTVVTEKLADLLIKDKPTRHKERWKAYATDAAADTKKQVQMFKPKTQEESLQEHFEIDLAAPPEVAAPVEAPPPTITTKTDGEILAGRIQRGEIDLSHRQLTAFSKPDLVEAAQILGIKATGTKGVLIRRIVDEAPKVEAPPAEAAPEEKPLAELPFLDDEIGTVRSIRETESKLIAKGENIGVLTQLWRPTADAAPGAQSTVRVVDKDAGEVVAITQYPNYAAARLGFIQARNADVIAKPPKRTDDARTEATGILAGKIKQAEDKGIKFYFPEDAPRAMTEDDFMELVGAVSGGYAERLVLEKDVVPLMPGRWRVEAEAPAEKKTAFEVFYGEPIESQTAEKIQDVFDTAVETMQRFQAGEKDFTQNDYDLALATTQEIEKYRPAEAPAPAEKAAPEHEKAAGSTKLANWINTKLVKDESITWRDLFKQADIDFAGTQAQGKYTPKDAYDAMEQGVNIYVHDQLTMRDPENAVENIAWLKDTIAKLPTQTKRTREQGEFQQFSTPPPLAYVANWVANIKENDAYLEPSAGVGGLAIFGRQIVGDNIVVNELDKRRAALLGEMGFKTVFTEDASQLDNILPETVKPTVIVMNPPFSATAGRVLGKRATKFGADQIEQALARLEDGGRLVAIVGKGMADNAPAFTKWWKGIKKDYTVSANVGISGQEYKKYGTTFDNRLIIIDKTGPQAYNLVSGKVDKIEDLIPLLEGVRNDRQTIYKPGEELEPVAGVAPVEQIPETERPGAEPPGAPPAAIPGVGPGVRPGEPGATPGIEISGAIEPPTEPGGRLPEIEGAGIEPGEPARPGERPGERIRPGDEREREGIPEAPDLSLDDLDALINEVIEEEDLTAKPAGGKKAAPKKPPVKGKIPKTDQGQFAAIANIIGNIKEPTAEYKPTVKAKELDLMTQTWAEEIGKYGTEKAQDTRGILKQLIEPLSNIADSDPIEMNVPGLEQDIFFANQKDARDFLEAYDAVLDDYLAYGGLINQAGAAPRSIQTLDNITTKIFPKTQLEAAAEVREPAAAFEALLHPQAYEQAKPILDANYTEFKGERKEWIRYVLVNLAKYNIDPEVGRNWIKYYYTTDRPDLARAPAPVRKDLIQARKKKREKIKASLYEEYQPNVEVKGARPHPTPLVETAALSDTDLPKATYKPDLPKHILKPTKKSAGISNVQLEFSIYAGQAHERFLPDGTRMGAFAGHGTGVGKGRIIASIMMDNWNKGRKKAIWLTEKQSLLNDASRDIIEMGWSEGAKALVNLNKAAAAGGKVKAKHRDNTILFSTYSTLGQGFKKINLNKPESFDDMRARINQIVEWAGADYDGVIAFDESHNMANSMQEQGARGRKPTADKALAGVLLQTMLPKARVIYVSATGATKVSNFAYAERLGLWGEGTSFADKRAFIAEINKSGLAAMEMIARGMKARGLYMAPSLSYDGVIYDRLVHELTEEQTDIYDKLAEAWQVIMRNTEAALELTNGNKSGRAKMAARGRLFGTQIRVFDSIMTAMQMPSLIRKMEKNIADGESVIIQLTQTNDAAVQRALERRQEGEDLEDLDFTPRIAISEYLQRAFPIEQYEIRTDKDGNEYAVLVRDEAGDPVENRQAVAMRDAMLREIGALRIPDSPLDQLFNVFGTDKIAEVTGRKSRVVKDLETGEYINQKWSLAKAKADVEAFKNDEKQILIFSEAGGTGVSYHADKRYKNQRLRQHYLLQPGWKASTAVQGLGRSHRSNQRQAPKYTLITTNLKAQKRFVTSIARRLDQLGALTKGQRQAGSQGIFQARDNLESDYAREALVQTFEDMVAGTLEMSAEDFQHQTGLQIVDERTGRLTGELPEMTKVLNRMLSMTINSQNTFFGDISDRLDRIIQAHAEAGTLDVGIETIDGLAVEKESERVVHTDPESGAETKYVRVSVTEPSRRVAFEDVSHLNFYQNIKSGRVWAAGETRDRTTTTGSIIAYRKMQSPNDTIQRQDESILTDEDKWIKLADKPDLSPARIWAAEYANIPETTDRDIHLITGDLLSVWDRLVGFATVYRMETDAGERLLGRVIHPNVLDQVLTNLGASADAPQVKSGVLGAKILGGARVTLANGWAFKKSMVSGDERIELLDFGHRDIDLLEKQGAIIEEINFKTRVFIPTKNNKKIFDRILLNRPVTNIAGGYQGPRIADTTLSEASAEFAGKVAKKIQAGKKAIQMDLLEYAQSAKTEKAVEALPEPTQKVEIRSTGEMGFESHVIANAEDAAAFIQPITEQAQEKGYMISVDAQGNIKEVHFIAKGARGAVGIPIVETVGRLFNTPGVTKAYFIHNHPSAEADPSPEDRAMAYTLIEMAAAGGVEIENIIVGGDVWALYSPISAAPSVKRKGKIRKTTRKTTIPIVERFIERGKRRGGPISNSGELTAHLEKYYNDRQGYLFLDNKLNDLGFVEFTPGQTASENLKEIIAEGERLNASVFIFNSKGTDAELNSRMKFLTEWNENVGGNMMQLFEFRHNGVSFADQGKVPSPKKTQDILDQKVAPITFDYILGDSPVFARKLIAPADPVTVEDVNTTVETVTAQWAAPGPKIRVYKEQQGLPPEVMDFIKEDGRENSIITGAYYKNTIYLVADNIGSNEEIVTTILHEGFGHHGLRGTLGKEGKDVFKVLRDLYIAKKNEVDKIGRELGFDLTTMDGQMQAAEEWFANQAQLGIKSKWYDRLVAAIRNWLRKLDLDIKLSNPEIRALIAAARQFTLTGQRVSAFPGQTPAFKKKKYGKAIDYGGILPEDVARRMAAAKGVGKGSFMATTKEKLAELKMERAHFPGLEKIENKKQRAQLADILRIHQEIPENARSITAEKMKDFIKDLSTDAYDIYTMNIILADMMRDIKTGLLNDQMLREGETLPFGFKTIQDVQTADAQFKRLAEIHPEIATALSDRKAYIDNMVGQLVKFKILKKEVLQHEDYFHHQVLQYWGLKDTNKGVSTGSADVRQHWRPWMAARKGSLLDYNTEYIEAEFTALSQQLGQLETAKTLERIKRQADIYGQLKDQAKRENLTNFYKQAARQLSIQFKTEITVGEVMADSKLDPLFPYRQKIAMASSQLENMAFNDKLGGDSEFADIIDQLAEIKRAKKEDLEGAPAGISDARYFDFLAYLVRTGQPGASWAATIFKNIHARNKHVQTALGKNFLTFRQLIPEGYEEWKPEPGKGWFWANTLADNVLQQVIAGERDLQDNDVKQILAKGRDIIWVMPTGLTETLDNFKAQIEQRMVGRISEASLRMWKQYILINPMRVMKYNINNMSGDLDITLAYNPKILKGFFKSLRDLRAFNKGKAGAAVKAELQLARKLGVTGSGWAVQEVEEITKKMGTDKFVRQIIMGEKPNIAMRYWQLAKGATTTRENILRLAAFRHFKQEIAKGKRVYGASKPDEIDAIQNDTERAAKLSRELVGDYGNISSSGQWIRKRLMPFYSWMEINSPRYVYMLRNVRYEGREPGARPLAIASKKALTKGLAYGAKAAMLYTLINIYNHLLWPEEEEEFGKSGRRQLHLILGRREDGSIMSIRFQGALSDTLSFFGLEDFPEDVKELWKGEKTIQQKLIEVPKALVTRLFHAIRPEPKMLMEAATGYATYPDPFSPRPIRDTKEHILRTFSLDAIYRRARGRPGRGKSMATHFLSDLERLVVYNSDPGEQAYYDTRNMIFDWKKDKGIEVSYGKPTNRGNALYYYKQALKFGDFKAAERYLMKYYDLGGKPSSLKQAIKQSHPLAGVKKMDRFKFKKDLNPAQLKTLERAIKWYDLTYRKEEPRKLRYETRRKFLKKKAAERAR